MKTKNAIITGTLIVFGLMNTSNLFAGDEGSKIKVSKEDTNIKQDDPQNISTDKDLPELKLEQIYNRQYLDDLVALPWLIKEVIIRPAKKSENTVEKKQCDNKQTACK